MALSDNFKNSFETSNINSDNRLLNHYYGSDYYKTQETIISLMKKEGFTLLHVDNHYHEMLLEKKKIQVLVTLSEMGIYETGVSLKVNTSYLISFARGLKWIESFYEKLDKSLVLKNKGNHNA